MTDPELVLAVLKQKLSHDQDQEPGQGQESCRAGHRCNVFL